MRIVPSLIVAALAAASAYTASAAPAVEVRSVSVHLLLSPSGELSEDISALSGFSSWNFAPVVPAGLSGQRFESYLVKVRVGSQREAYHKGRVGSVSVLSRRTKKVLYTSAVAGLYIGANGEAVIARLVQGNVCEPVTVVVAMGSSRVTKNLEFLCGE